MKITVAEWASRHYSPPPSEWTLAQWRRSGQIHPAPERVDRKWYVDENARRLIEGQASGDLVKRIA